MIQSDAWPVEATGKKSETKAALRIAPGWLKISLGGIGCSPASPKAPRAGFSNHSYPSLTVNAHILSAHPAGALKGGGVELYGIALSDRSRRISRNSGGLSRQVDFPLLLDSATDRHHPRQSAPTTFTTFTTSRPTMASLRDGPAVKVGT